jgi:hypothetical protein
VVVSVCVRAVVNLDVWMLDVDLDFLDFER